MNAGWATRWPDACRRNHVFRVRRRGATVSCLNSLEQSTMASEQETQRRANDNPEGSASNQAEEPNATIRPDEQLALAVNAMTRQFQDAMLADLQEDRGENGVRGSEREQRSRPRRVDALLQGLFEFIDAMSRGEQQGSPQYQDVDEKEGKGKGRVVQNISVATKGPGGARKTNQP
ncbi:hypothetical protein CALCODRAFT_537527 [Calocera cornea HHB12733]|uniref:Uncharacterized protein n=1 Tax=Calocera cornea HHB12733 TaxID=1353952 RepID=A0A165K1M6_9BASI|nr:hypothetical protein CALCODRAFT_537527 [Calocera cornea HHB12733]